MAQELQALLDRIQSEGVDKANEKAGVIRVEAERAAAGTVAAAEKKAADIITSAQAAADSLRERAEQAARQAARDVVLDTESKIRQTLERVLLRDTETALAGDLLKTLLETVVRGVVKNGVGGIEVLVPAAQVDELAQFAASRLAAEVRDGLKISASGDVKSGIRVMVNNGRIEHDFTGTTLTVAMSGLMNQNLAKILFG